MAKTDFSRCDFIYSLNFLTYSEWFPAEILILWLQGSLSPSSLIRELHIICTVKLLKIWNMLNSKTHPSLKSSDKELRVCGYVHSAKIWLLFAWTFSDILMIFSPLFSITQWLFNFTEHWNYLEIFKHSCGLPPTPRHFDFIKMGYDLAFSVKSRSFDSSAPSNLETAFLTYCSYFWSCRSVELRA